MSLGRVDSNGGLRWLPRAVITLAATVVVVLVFAPMARAGMPPADRTTPDRATADSAVATPGEPLGYGSVRPRNDCFTTYRSDDRQSIAPAAVADPRVDLSGGQVAFGSCGQPSPSGPYGLGSLLWRGPDWGDPTLGHRT